MAPPRENMEGKRFGRLNVIAPGPTKVSPSGWTSTTWECVCDCGQTTIVRSKLLKTGRVVSCGCKKREGRTTVKHDASYTPEYRAWAQARSRCLNPKHQAYANYGGRGITMCRRWANSFLSFLADMGKRPSRSHSLDRIDNDGNYEPGNCRWATLSEQSKNRRTFTIIRNGRTVTITGADKPT